MNDEDRLIENIFKSKDNNYNEKCDVYSFGIIIWGLICRLQPYENLEWQQIYFRVPNETSERKK